ncbi:hypothetical protein KBY93_14855 [Synechococcus sp. J7-Johnson]|nr:hypothetical protein [Synechococcus sp. J7-Johnson]
MEPFCLGWFQGSRGAPASREERAEQIRRLRSGELQILFAVDLFNEGLDIPEIETVLRPRSAPLPGQELPHGARFHRPGPSPLPPRPPLPRPARRHARPAAPTDRSRLPLPPRRLQPPARSRLG